MKKTPSHLLYLPLFVDDHRALRKESPEEKFMTSKLNAALLSHDVSFFLFPMLQHPEIRFKTLTTFSERSAAFSN